MGTSLNSDAVEKKYVELMGSELGPVYNRLQAECTLLNSTWRQFIELFATNEKRVEVLKWSAEYFFHVVSDVFLESTLLKLSRITDPPSMGKRQNVTLALLPSLVEDVLRPQIDAALLRVNDSTTFARDWRNRHIAHQDFSLTFSDSALPLAVVTRKKVTDAIADVNSLLNLVESYYVKGTIAFERLIAGGQADHLIQVLNEEFQRNQEFMARLKSDTLSEADLTRKFRDRV
jgi:hypothetical protein